MVWPGIEIEHRACALQPGVQCHRTMGCVGRNTAWLAGLRFGMTCPHRSALRYAVLSPKRHLASRRSSVPPAATLVNQVTTSTQPGSGAPVHITVNLERGPLAGFLSPVLWTRLVPEAISRADQQGHCRQYFDVGFCDTQASLETPLGRIDTLWKARFNGTALWRMISE